MKRIYTFLIIAVIGVGLLMMGCATPLVPVTASDDTEIGKIVVSWENWDAAGPFKVYRSTDPTITDWTSATDRTPSAIPGKIFEDKHPADIDLKTVYFYNIYDQDEGKWSGYDGGVYGDTSEPGCPVNDEDWLIRYNAIAEKFEPYSGNEFNCPPGDEGDPWVCKMNCDGSGWGQLSYSPDPEGSEFVFTEMEWFECEDSLLGDYELTSYSYGLINLEIGTGYIRTLAEWTDHSGPNTGFNFLYLPYITPGKPDEDNAIAYVTTDWTDTELIMGNPYE